MASQTDPAELARFRDAASFSVDDFHFSLRGAHAPEASPETDLYNDETGHGAFLANSDDEDDISLFSEHPSSPSPPPPKTGKREKLKSAMSSLSMNFSSTPPAPPPPGAPGLIWHAQLIPDDSTDSRYVLPDGSLKKRRPKPFIRVSNFFESLERVGTKWILRTPHGLNDWPGLDGLIVKSVTGLMVNKLGRYKVKRFWDSDKDGLNKPTCPNAKGSVRVTLQAPEWTDGGWSKGSPGYFWWLTQPDTTCPPEMLYGAKAIGRIEAGDNPVAVRAHHFGHRYAKAKESAKDQLVYHCCVLVEWDHGNYCTMFELAWINGVTGNAGKSNWQEDRDAHPNQLLQSLLPHPNLVQPWDSSLAELRVQDLPGIKTFEDFQDFVKKYTGTAKECRFIDPQYISSSNVRLSKARKSDMAEYLLNYILHNKTYSEEARNCQTFAADLYRLLSGSRTEKPYHPINQILYREHTHAFFYNVA